MNDNRDILVKCRQQAAVCKEQGHVETHAFLTELADEIERLRRRVNMMAMVDSMLTEKFVNGA